MPAFDRDDNRTIDEHYSRTLDPAIRSGEGDGSGTPYTNADSGNTTDDVANAEGDAPQKPGWANKVTDAVGRVKESGAPSFIMKAGAPAAVIGVVVVIAIIIAISFSGFANIIVTTAQKAVEQTMNAAPAITMLRGMQLSQQRFENLKGDTLKGICGNVISIKCKLGTFSESDIKAMEREGIKVESKKGSFWDNLRGRGRYSIASITIGNNSPMSPEEVVKAIKSGDRTVTTKLTSALEPQWKSFAKNSFYKVLAKVGGSKAVNIKSGVDRAAIEQELIDRVSGKAAAMDRINIRTSKDGNGVEFYEDPETHKIYKGEELDKFIASKDEAYEKIRAVKDQVKLSGDKISEFAAKNSVKSLAIGVGIAQLGCAGWNVVRTAEAAATQSGMQSMASYAMVFLNQASMIRAGEGQADVSGYLGDTLTTPDSSGKSGPDSRAGKQLFYGEQSPLPQTTYADPQNPTEEEQKQAVLNSQVTNYTAGATMGPEVLKAIARTASVNTDSPDWLKDTDTVCSVINNPWVGGVMLGAGITVLIGCFASAIIPVAGAATMGGCAADLVIQAGTFAAIMGVLIGLQQLLSNISGTLITGKENGPEAMQAFTTGSEVLGYYNGLNNGLTTGSTEDANSFQQTVVNPAKKTYADIDRQQYAWYDASNSNTFIGGIVSSLYPKFASLSGSSNAAQIFSSLGSIIASPLSLLGSTAKAIDGQTASSACGSTLYSGLALSQNCTPLAVTSQKVLNIGINDAVDYLQDHGEIDELGNAIGPHITEYIKYCSSEREAVRGMYVEGSEISNDVTTGGICNTTYDKDDAETYRNIQAYMQITGGTSDVEIFSRESSGSQTGTSSGACPSGSTVIPSITDGWSEGKKTTITLCAITGADREKPIVEGEFKRKVYNGLAANGVNEIALTSDAAAAYMQMTAKAKENDKSLNATFSYRSYNEQKAIRGSCGNSGSCKSSDQKKLNDDGSLSGDTLPGNYDENRASAGYSNHQSGLSLDISSGKSWIDKCIAGESYDGADDGRCFGFYFDLSNDPVHLTYKPK